MGNAGSYLLLIFPIIILVWIFMPSAKTPPADYAHIVLFENSKKSNSSRYKIVINGEDVSSKFGADSDGFIRTHYLDWEGKFNKGCSLRSQTGLEPLFYHKVYLKGEEPNYSYGYGKIKSYYHENNPQAMYEAVLDISKNKS